MAEKDLGELRELVEFLKANGVATFDMEREDLKVRLTFAGAEPAAGPAVSAADLAQLARIMAPASAAVAPALPMEAGAAAGMPAPASVATAMEPAPPPAGHLVKSPIVGTFYDAPSPGADTFVRVGDRVVTGQVLCIVEAMKLMNEVESDASGIVSEIFVITGQPVEYGQKLFAITT